MTTPDTVAPGEYRLLYVLDALNELEEADETNNVFVSPNPVIVEVARPELEVGSANAPDYLVSGWTEPWANITIRNWTGTADAHNVSVHAYLSSDDILDDADVLLGSTVVDTIERHHIESGITFDLAVPDTVPFGDYRVIYVIDQQNTISERDETNNSIVIGDLTTIGPARVDLNYDPAGFITPDAIYYNLGTVVQVGVSNLTGTSYTNRFSLQVYLSSDDVLDDTDVLVGTVDRLRLRAGEIENVRMGIMAPTSLAEGDYRLIYVLDPDNNVAELSEANNTIVTDTVHVELAMPDLETEYVSTPFGRTMVQGYDTVRILNMLNTNGTNMAYDPASDVTVNAYLSSDDILDASDTFVGTVSTGHLENGHHERHNITLSIPETLAEGEYRLIYHIDPLDIFDERDETNNITVVEGYETVLPPLPELRFWSAGYNVIYQQLWSGIANAGIAEIASVSVTNETGLVEATNVTVNAYLVDQLNENPTLIGSTTIESIAAGATDGAFITITVPYSVSSGDYRIMYSIDPDDQIRERVETNNITYESDLLVTNPGNSDPAGYVQISGSSDPAIDLVADTGRLSDANEFGAFSYRWLRDGVVIAGATSDTYQLTPDDANSDIGFAVSYTDGIGVDELVLSTSIHIPQNNSDLFLGDGNNNVITGNQNDNYIYGFDGNDTLSGGQGADALAGGNGRDTLTGGEGDDSLVGGAGDDTAVFSGVRAQYSITTNANGTATVRHSGGSRADGTDALNSIEFVRFSDTTVTLEFNGAALLSGTLGDDILIGTTANDILLGLAGVDMLFGGAGDDVLEGGSGRDRLDGGYGNDTASYANSSAFVSVYLTGIETIHHGDAQGDTLIDIENITGSDYGDFISGNYADNILRGGGGNDTLRGGRGDDTLYGGSGNDAIIGEDGADILLGGDGNDDLDGGIGTDILIGGDGDDTMLGGSGRYDLRDRMYGGNGNDSIYGGYGNDELRGDAGDDTISGGPGADRVIGGTGNDILTGGSFGDEIFGGDGDDFINGGFGHDRVNGGADGDKFYHHGIADHGSDWIQDYNAAEGDVLMWGGHDSTASDFLI
ncbi:CARDB domain-containing protein [Profundibacter sp.]